MPRYQKSGGFDRLNVSNLITTSSKQTVEGLTTDTTLDANDSGKIFTLDLAAGAVDVTLPSPGSAGAGWTVTIIQNITSPTAANTIESNAANIYGAVVASDGTATAVATGEQTITFATGSDEGDLVTLISNGTKYFVTGTVAVNTSITIA